MAAEWIKRNREYEEAQKAEADRRRVCHKSRQQLRYMKAILYGGQLPKPPTMSAV